MFPFKNQLFNFLYSKPSSQAQDSTGQALAQGLEPEFISNELLIKVKKEVKDQIRQNPQDTGISSLNGLFKTHQVKNFEKVAKEMNDSIKDAGIFRWYKVTLEGNGQKVKPDDQNGIALLQIIEEFKKDPSIEVAEPNFFYNIDVEPNDPYYLDKYPDQVGGRDPNWNPPHDYQWNIKKTNSSSNWEKDVSNITVAVIDTGVDVTHPDLGAVWENPVEATGSAGVDDDGNKCVDDINGCNYNFFHGRDDGDIADDNNHGTHVSGVISAKTNNALGIAGVTSNAKIMAVKVLDAMGSGLANDIAQGTTYAADMGAKVLNMSLGGSYSGVMKDALDYAVSKEVIPVVAAGNGNDYSPAAFPASYKKAITVGGVEEELNKMRYANYGPNIDVAAPGGGKPCMYYTKPSYCSNILSLKSSQNNEDLDLVVGERYLRFSGTSMATPHVAGVVALLLSQNPSWGLSEIENYIRFNSIDPEGKGHNEKTGWGVISSTGTNFVPPSNIDFVINYPAENSLIGKQFYVAGTIKADNFDHFEVLYRKQGSPDWSAVGVELVNGGTSQIIPASTRIVGKIATVTLPDDFEKGVYEVKTILHMTNGKILNSTKNVHYLAKTNTQWFPYDINGMPPQSGDILVADLNQDGNKEIVLYNYNLYNLNYEDKTMFAVFDNKYNLLWIKERVGRDYPEGGMVIGDIDKRKQGKEIAWLVKRNFGLPIEILVYDWAGNQINDMTIANLPTTLEYNFLTIDSDNNGSDELYFIGSGGKLYSFEQNTDGQFLQKWSYQFTGGLGGFDVQWPVAGDVNGDGFKEIIVYDSGKLKILNHLGKVLGEYVSGDDVVNLADLDKDGKEEIITRTRWSDIKVLKFNDNTLNLLWSYDTSKYGSSESLSIADFDKDGYPDIYFLFGFYSNALILNKDGQLIFKHAPPIYFSAKWLGHTLLADRDNNGSTEIYQIGDVGRDNRQYFNTIEYDSSTKEMGFIDSDWKAVIPQWSPFSGNHYGEFNPSYPIVIEDLDNNGKLDLVIGGLGIIEYPTQGKVFWPQKYHDYQRTGSYNFSPKEEIIPKISYSLTPGWNSIGIPLNVTINPSELLSKTEGKCTSLVGVNPISQKLSSYPDNGTTEEVLGSIDSGYGYLIYCNDNSSFILSGSDLTDYVKMYPGNQIITVPQSKNNILAANFLQEISTQDPTLSCPAVAKYDKSTNTWNPVHFLGASSDNNFQMSSNEGYLVYCQSR